MLMVIAGKELNLLNISDISTDELQSFAELIGKDLEPTKYKEGLRRLIHIEIVARQETDQVVKKRDKQRQAVYELYELKKGEQ